MTRLSFEDLADAATIGLSRRPVTITELAGLPGLPGPPGAAGRPGVAGLTGAGAATGPGGLPDWTGPDAGLLDQADPAAALLDAAALLTAARRAGVRPARGVRCPAPADADTRPELPPDAAAVLGRVLAAEPGLRSGLLAGLLAETARRGYRAPPPMLPALLDAAGREPGLRPLVAAVLGSRGRWLARHRPDWERVAGAGVPAVRDDPVVWATGHPGERLGYLTMLRRRDPAAARELLAAGWSGETGDDRAVLLAVLRDGLSAADEGFLEAALDDRKAAVRDAAAGLLAGLPGSAFTRRADERAAGLVRAEPDGPGSRLVIRLPLAADRAMTRDGIGTGPSPSGLGAGAWLLTQLVAAAPLAGWVRRFGLEPAQIVLLAVAGDLCADVQAGWRRAAISQASPEWAAALLKAGPWVLPAGGRRGGPAARRPELWPGDAELSAVLPPEDRAARGAELLAARIPPVTVIAEVAAYPGPWPDLLARAVLGTLRHAAAAGSAHWPAPLVAAAARNLPVTGPGDYAAALTDLADIGPATWAAGLRRAAVAVALRRTFEEEIR